MIMEIIAGGRATGKTHNLVLKAVANDGVILVADVGRRERVMQMVRSELRNNGHGPSSAVALAERMVMVAEPRCLEERHFHQPSVYIDDLEPVLINLLRHEITVVSTDVPIWTPQGRAITTYRPNPHIGA